VKRNVANSEWCHGGNVRCEGGWSVMVGAWVLALIPWLPIFSTNRSLHGWGQNPRAHEPVWFLSTSCHLQQSLQQAITLSSKMAKPCPMLFHPQPITFHNLAPLCVVTLLALMISHTLQSSLQHVTSCSNNGHWQAITLLPMTMQPCHLMFHPLPMTFHDLAPPYWAATLQALMSSCNLQQSLQHVTCRSSMIPMWLILPAFKKHFSTNSTCWNTWTDQNPPPAHWPISLYAYNPHPCPPKPWWSSLYLT